MMQNNIKVNGEVTSSSANDIALFRFPRKFFSFEKIDHNVN